MSRRHRASTRPTIRVKARAFAQRPTNELKGLVAYISTEGLRGGRHELMVGREPDGSESTYTLTRETDGGEEFESAPPAETETTEGLADPGTESEAEAQEARMLAFRYRYIILFWTPKKSEPRSAANIASNEPSRAAVVAQLPSPTDLIPEPQP